MATRVYRTLSIITLSTQRPGAGSPTSMGPQTQGQCLMACARLPGLIHQYSGGMGSVETTIRMVEDTITSDLFTPLLSNGMRIVSPNLVSEALGEDGRYDIVNVFSATTQVIPNGYRGLATTTHGGTWIQANAWDILNIAVHETIHMIEAHMYTEGYRNWPSCAANDPPVAGRSLHCGDDPLYLANGSNGDMDAAWFTQMLSGTVYDGTGMTQEAWDIETPGELGDREPIDPYRISKSPWGYLGPIVIPAVTGGGS